MNKLWLILLPLLLISQVRAEEKVEIEEVVVTAVKLEESVEETTSDVTVIKSEDIEKMNIDFVPDALRTIPELNIVQNGGAGKQTSVLLRGGGSQHTLIMIDGIKVNSTTTGSFDFSGINVDDIERIEIVKGPQSTIYGSEAMAGVINIITKKGSGNIGIDASLEAGSNRTYKSASTVSGGYKKFDYRLTGAYFYTEGISAAKDGSERDGYRNSAVSGKFGIRPSEKFELEFTGNYYYDRSDLDAFGADDPNYVQYGKHYFLSTKGKLYLTNFWEQILTLSKARENLRYRDPDTSYHNAEVITEMNTVDWQHNFYVSDIYILTTGAEYRQEKGKNTGSFNRSLDNKALYFNNKLKLFKEGLIINAGLRYDDHETFGEETTYRIGAVYNVKPLEMRVKGSYGTGFRAPKLNDLFYKDPWGSAGNPDLKPEESRAWEIGVEKDFLKGRATFSATYFEQYYDNLIEWVEIAPFTWQYTPKNIAEAEVRGGELGATVKISGNIGIGANYTYLDTEDEEGQRLPFRPKDKLHIFADFSIKDLSVISNYIFVGKRHDSLKSKDLAAYSVINLSGSYKVTKWLSVFARVENLLNEDYEEAGGYNAAGFSIFGGVKLTTL